MSDTMADGGGGAAEQYSLVHSHSRDSSVSLASSGGGDLATQQPLSVSALCRGGSSGAKDSPRSEDSGVVVTMGQATSASDTMERLEPEGTCEEDSGQNFASFLSVDKRLFGRLQEELTHAQSELKLKEEQVVKLSRIRDDVEREMEDLTASLFQVIMLVYQTLAEKKY